MPPPLTYNYLFAMHTMMAKPIKILESYYPMIQFLIIIDDSVIKVINAHVFHLIKENLTNERILQTDVTLDLFYFC